MLWAAFLGCGPPCPGTLQAPTEPTQQTEPRRWTSVLANPCAMDEDGMVACWADVDGTTGSTAVTSLATNGGELVGSYGDAIFTHRQGAGVEVHRCDMAWYCDLQTAPFAEAAPSSGLTADGRLHSWTDSGLEVHPDTGFHALGSDSSSAVSADNTLTIPVAIESMRTYWEIPLDPDANYLQSVAHWRIQPAGIPDISGCVLDDAGHIECVGVGIYADAVFDNGPYRFIDGDRGVMCAVRRADDVIECSDGTVHDFGPIIDLSVTPYQHSPDGETWIRTDASLCVITVDNAIRCAGPHYPQDLLDQLEALPR
jgi:hypothetical protein